MIPKVITMRHGKIQLTVKDSVTGLGQQSELGYSMQPYSDHKKSFIKSINHFSGVQGYTFHTSVVKDVDLDNPVTHWARPRDPENEADVSRISKM